MNAFGPVHPFMVWNLYLAAIPALLALVLFRRPQHLSVSWGLGFVAWVLFLPNAPYVLTDVVHMLDDLHVSSGRRSYEVLFTYAVLFAGGLCSYVLSLQLFRRFLHRVAPPRVVLPTLLALHGVCVVAMYLGRFMRFNSWDAVFDPGAVLESVLRVPRPTTVVILAVMFVVVGIGAFITSAVFGKAYAHLRRLIVR